MLVTSRAESDIGNVFIAKSHIRVEELDIASEGNANDVLHFLFTQMAEIRSVNAILFPKPDWPGKANVHALAKHAAGLFVWASTACRFIDGHDPRKRLSILLGGDIGHNAESALDSLYRIALISSGRWDDEDFCSDFCSIVGAILVARNSMSDRAIDTLLSLDRPSRYTITQLRCVLHWSDAEPIRVLHPSFAEFLSSWIRCGYEPWHINISMHNQRLAMLCITHLDSVLTQNICDLALTAGPINEALPGALTYSAKSWIDHVCLIKQPTMALADALEKYLFQHLLHWLEAMSILKESRSTITSVHHLLIWLTVRSCYIHIISVDEFSL
jgi:hypothetical protein